MAYTSSNRNGLVNLTPQGVEVQRTMLGDFIWARIDTLKSHGFNLGCFAVGLACVVAGSSVVAGQRSEAGAQTPVQRMDYIAVAGDNLWNISHRIDRNDDGELNEHRGQSVSELAEQLGTYDVFPGDSISVPAAADLRPDLPGVQLGEK